MTLKCIATSSEGNSFVLTNESGKHLMIEAGLPIGELKKGIDFDVENWQGLIVSHGHADHALSADKVRKMGIPVWEPYKDMEHKRLRTKLGDFQIDSFPVPHNGCENRNFLIKVDGQTILYLIDLEYCPYDFSKQPINILICECNYIEELVDDDIPNIRHKVLGHASLDTTIGIIQNCQKHLRKVILTHMSKGETFNKEIAMKRITEAIPAYIQVNYAEDGKSIDLSEIPF
jgi:phosphoribosyl 1,2-cyclic phosphodiesterase